MTDPNVFYNREDLWQIPNEKYGDSTQAMEPYYSILQLPGEEEPELLLVLPFTPSSRDNMIAWMAGRSDGDSYGELLVYLFPKDRVVFGPMQVETRIDQDTLISEQLSHRDQRGSHVLMFSGATCSFFRLMIPFFMWNRFFSRLNRASFRNWPG